MSNTLKRTISLDTLADLFKKNCTVILCGSNDEPSVELSIDPDDDFEDLDDALDQVKRSFESWM